jgi:hypothetical protein
MSRTPRSFELGEQLHPELRSLCLLEADPEQVAVALEGDAQGEVAGLALHAAALADLQDERVEEEQRRDVVERALLPLAHVLDDGVGDPARSGRGRP